MGFFGNLINDAKRRVEEESAPITARLQAYDTVRKACRFYIETYPELKNIAVQANVTMVLKRRINQADDTNDLYHAFADMYKKGQSNNRALNVSQWLGERLYELDDSRINYNENGDGHRFYKLGRM